MICSIRNCFQVTFIFLSFAILATLRQQWVEINVDDGVYLESSSPSAAVLSS